MRSKWAFFLTCRMRGRATQGRRPEMSSGGLPFARLAKGGSALPSLRPSRTSLDASTSQYLLTVSKYYVMMHCEHSA